MKKTFLWFVVCGAMALAPGQVMGTTIILGNLPPTNDGSQSAGLNNLRIKAIQFTMPVGPGYFLTDVVLRLRGYDATESPIVQIRDDANPNPGAGIIATLTNPAGQGAGIVDYTFTAPPATVLAGGTPFWLYVSGQTGQAFDWMASSPGITPTGVATFGLNRFTTNGGSSWTNSTIINSFQIVGKLVPEPSGWLLLGLSCLILARRRR